MNTWRLNSIVLGTGSVSAAALELASLSSPTVSGTVVHSITRPLKFAINQAVSAQANLGMIGAMALAQTAAVTTQVLLHAQVRRRLAAAAVAKVTSVVRAYASRPLPFVATPAVVPAVQLRVARQLEIASTVEVSAVMEPTEYSIVPAADERTFVMPASSRVMEVTE